MEDTFIIADSSNYVLKSIKNSFQKLYRHYSKINALITNEKKNLIISGGADKEVFFFSLENNEFPIMPLYMKEEICCIDLNEAHN